MYRFFVPLDQIQGEQAYIYGDDVNHIKNVLRMDIGERVVLSNGRGQDFNCHITELQAEQVCLAVDQVAEAISELPGEITLYQALPKGDKMELIIQKAVELGASRIVPVRTKRCVVKLDDKKAKKKRERWQTIATAAAKQSGRGIIPEVSAIMDFGLALKEAAQMEGKIIPYELCEDMQQSVEVIRQLAKCKTVAVFIGPEGGFERGEIEKAIQHTIQPVSLGKRILRTETAGMTLLSVVMFEMEATGTR